jgi:arylsulfatase A-like enzyme
VPFLARWPGRIAPGSENLSPIYFADLLPTLAEVAGAPAPKVDGTSLVPLFAGKPGPNRTLHWEHFSYDAKTQQLTPQGAAVRFGKWKAVMHKLGQRPELYDLTNDEGETNDLSLQNPRIARRMATSIREAHTPPLPHTGIMDWVR